jgi:hypothetical protein
MQFQFLSLGCIHKAFQLGCLNTQQTFQERWQKWAYRFLWGKKKQVKTGKEPKLTSMVRDIHGRMYGRPLTGNFFGSPQGFGKFSLHHPGIYT